MYKIALPRPKLSVVALLAAALAVLVVLAPLGITRAQNSGVTVSIAVPNFVRDALNDQLIADFQNKHPGINVNIIRYDASIAAQSSGIDAHLAALQTYASQADVLYFDGQRTNITPMGTRAGYFLDLTPLVGEDKGLNVDDFVQPLWQSYQWDKGIWALPISASMTIMSYDPAAFDQAGLAYPSEKWTIDDLSAAVNKLGQKGSSGTLTVPGLVIGQGSVPILLRSLLSTGVYDPSTVPNPPQLDTPPVEALLDSWLKLDQTGLISNSNGNANSAPLTVGNAAQLLFRRGSDANQKRNYVLLPGNKAGLGVQAFAISSGTQVPEQAYALASYLTTRADLASRFGTNAARKSLAAQSVAQGGPGGPGGGPGGRNRNLTPEVQAVFDQALTNGIPVAEMRYMDYVNVALQQMKTSSTDAKTALQAVEVTAQQSFQAAANKKQSLALAVATPIPVPTLGAGKVALKFGLSSFTSPLPNQDKWNKVIADFTATDPQVGRLVIDQPTGGGQIANFTDKFDCFYMPFNAVPNTTLGMLINLDPFMTADTSFDKGDFVGNVIDQVQRDNKIWAYPIIVEPSILKYNSDQFAKSNVPAPISTWTIDAFKDAVKALKTDPADPAPFAASNTNGTYLLQLIAAYGGLPLDYRTNPPGIDFTSQANVDAIRQVLDLAKQGYIQYNALAANTFGGNRAQRDVPIYSDVLNAFSFRFNVTDTTNSVVYKPTNYPRGSKFAAVSYTIGTGYVSAKSQNPEACYRWLSTVAKHPDLFSAMPARRSLITDPAMASAQGADNTALYAEIDKLLKDPNTISFPQLFGGGASPTGFLLQHWLYEAFDSYVLNNGDLDTALKDAETYAKGFAGCAANIPPYDPSTQQLRDYNQQYAACAAKVDPRLSSMFGN